MAAATTPAGEIGAPAPDFSLRGVDDRHWTLAACRGSRGTLVMFICNHCPYVQAVLDRIIRDASELEALGVASVAIMSNDTEAYPADAFPEMRALAKA
ncbi:MAG: redoxin domain-containing protein [Litoreibacter sp.]|nr:redoxin domain-containing protein [Litoreibacter sp.]